MSDDDDNKDQRAVSNANLSLSEPNFFNSFVGSLVVWLVGWLVQHDDVIPLPYCMCIYSWNGMESFMRNAALCAGVSDEEDQRTVVLVGGEALAGEHGPKEDNRWMRQEDENV